MYAFLSAKCLSNSVEWRIFKWECNHFFHLHLPARRENVCNIPWYGAIYLSAMPLKTRASDRRVQWMLNTELKAAIKIFKLYFFLQKSPLNAINLTIIIILWLPGLSFLLTSPLPCFIGSWRWPQTFHQAILPSCASVLRFVYSPERTF